MAKNRKVQYHGKRPGGAKSGGTAARVPRDEVEAPRVYERTPPKRYGKPFTLLEDANKNTFLFQQGKWVAHARSIAECRIECQVNQLPQKVNGMTRYEVRDCLA